MNAYLFGPVDLDSGSECGTWKAILNQQLAMHFKLDLQPWTLYDPAAPWMFVGVPNKHSRERALWIERVNGMALAAADILVGYLPSNVASIGSPIEIDLAFRQNKPIILVTTIPIYKSVYLTNRIHDDNYIEHMEDDSFDRTMGKAAARMMSIVSANQPVIVRKAAEAAVAEHPHAN